MKKSTRFRPFDTWGWGLLSVGLLLLGGGHDVCRADGPNDVSGPLGFPTGPHLRSIIAGEGGASPHQAGNPVRLDWGPAIWGQEGGSATRNPFFSSPPLSGLDPARGPSIPPAPDGSGGLGPKKTVLDRPVPWSVGFGAGPINSLEYRFPHQPLLVRGRILLSSTRGKVLCLDALTGATLWQVRLPESIWASGVADENAFYVVSGSPYVTAPHMMGYAQTRKIRRGEGPGHLYALSLLSGKILWTEEVPGPAIGSPVLEDGKIWVATGNGRLSGFSVDKERKILDMPLFSSAGWSSPLFVHHWLWVSLEGPTKLVALWPEKKRTVWSLTTPPTERLVLFTPTPAFGAMRLETLLLSVTKGVPNERLAIASAVTGHIFHEVPFVQTGEKGTPVAPVPPDLPDYARVYEGMTGPVVAGQTTVVASRILGRAMAVDIPSGHLFWSLSLPSPAVGSGTVAGLLYILPLSDRLLFIDLKTGHVLRSRPLKSPPAQGSPPVIDTTLYLAERDGRVRAFSLEQYRSLIFPPPPHQADQGQGEGEAGDNG